MRERATGTLVYDVYFLFDLCSFFAFIAKSNKVLQNSTENDVTFFPISDL